MSAQPDNRVDHTAASGVTLKRTLGLWDLVLYGVIIIQPTAPMSVFGVLSDRAHGHVVTTLLIAMVAMLFTAISYGRMARAYPSAGSAFTYVGRELSPVAGYITGWSMLMDYVLNPIICVIWISDQTHAFLPAVPHWMFILLYTGLFLYLNILGVKTSARVNAGLALFMTLVILAFFVAATRYLDVHAHPGFAFFTRPFYDPQTFNPRAVLQGTSVAVLAYIGFDGISTLSEEAENPRRNILLATVLTCICIGILSAIQVYLAQLVWPASQPFPNLTTAFVSVAGRVWPPLFPILGLTLIVANFGSGMAAEMGAARLLYGMGRSKALPQAFFGVLDPKRRVPRNSVLFVSVIVVVGAFLLTFDLGAEMLNFGALIAFMGVNLAALMRYYVREPEKKLINLFPPLIGFLVCLLLFLGLGHKAQLVGAIWMILGIAFGAWKTSGFRSALVDFEIPGEEDPTSP